VQAFTNNNFGHDEIDHSRDVLRRWQAARRGQRYWPIPAVVARGPLPRCASTAKRMAACVVASTTATFTTSRTYLETLFPTDDLRFLEADTVCRASIVATEARGEGGKPAVRQLALRVHGVQYRRGDGTLGVGTYVPVAFASSAGANSDSASEEDADDGIPRLRCGIETTTDGKTWQLTAAVGEGAIFAHVSVPAGNHGLGGADDVEASPHVTFRHVEDGGGKADAGGQDAFVELGDGASVFARGASSSSSSSLASSSSSSLASSLPPMGVEGAARRPQIWFDSAVLGAAADVGEEFAATVHALAAIPVYAFESVRTTSSL
jgi:hypothetical protein